MRLAVIGLYAIGIIGVTTALPIPSVALGDRNVFLVGALAFISFGAILAGCVCCRRRKKGFEEFRNESGTPEASKTEYPIFRALSPESQRNAATANAAVSAVNNSNENLIEEDFDNNNGPISPADLENIENNNAVDYIQNQNEVGIDIEPSPYSRNRNLPALDQVESPALVQEVIISSTDDFLEPLAGHVTQSHLESIPINIIPSHSDDINGSDECLLNTIQQVPLPILESVQVHCIDSPTLESSCHNKTFALDSAVIEMEHYANKDVNNLKELTKVAEIVREESASLKSNSSEKSGEINSVEEALRALDSAIAGEDFLNNGGEEDDDIDDDLIDEDFECNNTNFQNVIRQLLINNGVNNLLPDLTEDQVNINVNSFNIDNNLECIRTEAEKLVDSILSESQKVASERAKNLNHFDNECVKIDGTNIVAANCIIEHNIQKSQCDVNGIPAELYEKTITKSDKNLNSPDLTPESMETFFSFDIMAKTSTPCIQHKFTSMVTEEYISKVSRKNINQELFKHYDDDLNIASQPHNDCIILDKTLTLNTTPTKITDVIEDITFPLTKYETDAGNQTFDVNNKTFDVAVNNALEDDSPKEFIHPGDPCTSKQALERDCGYPSIIFEREEMNSEDLTTITPVNTPIELNYNNETWNKMTKNSNVNMDESHGTSDDNGFENGGWFLHPQSNTTNANETFDVEDDENLELTFEALRKQLAEVLPQPQGISGPPEYSDDEEEHNNRTFDEYRSPLDGLLGLLEADTTPTNTVQNELFINYKRALSPIIEESEEETCKTFVMNETKCLDSTSTGCVDTGEAIMGVTKTLMASNDTLFNFEDTLGEKEDVFSPRTPSRTETQATTPVKSGKSTEESSLATIGSEHERDHHSGNSIDERPGRRSPPKTIDIPPIFDITNDSELCSPEQQKTFSDGTSSTTDRLSSDLSATVDHDNTFTTNTIDDRTCITVIIKDDERISEISEPDWGSTASYGGYEMNSLTDVPSLDYNVNNIDEKVKIDVDDESQNINVPIEVYSNETTFNQNIILLNEDIDSGNNSTTHLSSDEKTSSGNTSEDETQKCEANLLDSTLMNQQHQHQSEQHSPSNLQINLEDREKCRQFLMNEVEISSSQNAQHQQKQQQQQYINKRQEDISLLKEKQKEEEEDNNDGDSTKENTNPNIKLMLNNLNDFDKISYQKVQTNSQDTVIVDKSKNISSPDLYEKNELTNGMHENSYYQPILPTKHQQTITNYSVSDVDGVHNEQNCLVVADEIIGHLSGEEDPWAEPLNELRFTGPCSELISTSFTVNEWDSDVDDSHSSEEFMYVRGTPSKEEISEILRSQSEDSGKSLPAYEGSYDTDVWSSHEDKVIVGDSAEDEISEESSSEFEGEFVPSCWDSLATPARSALKSPDKSSSQPNKKRRSVAFKKQRYHSVYEYPRENASLSPAYSEPFLWNRNSDNSFYDKDSTQEFSDGFTVSSSMRPFHGSQFNALCHTWPTDSDFSWSQVEDLGDIIDDKKLATYTITDIKWPQNYDNIDLDEEDKTDDSKIDESIRPDSGVGESAEMLSDRALLGELCHTKSKLRLPLDLLPPTVDTLALESKPEPTGIETFSDTLILPTPSCTGSMDSISSSSSSERQVSFSTFGKRNAFTTDNEKRLHIDTININEHIKPALILIENEPIESNNLSGGDKIKQSDSTDEDSGIESIMKINKESD